ncbi:hypothetical protein GEMRC1_013693 [Eukaryota sp. GEM-RC1]
MFIPCKTKRYCSWLDWVVSEGLPFSVVEFEVTRCYTNLQPICFNTFVDLFDCLKEHMYHQLESLLGSCFALIINAWKSLSTKLHYLGIFAMNLSLSSPVFLSLLPL